MKELTQRNFVLVGNGEAVSPALCTNRISLSSDPSELGHALAMQHLHERSLSNTGSHESTRRKSIEHRLERTSRAIRLKWRHSATKN